MVVLLQVASDAVRNSMSLAVRGRLDSGSSLFASGKLLFASSPVQMARVTEWSKEAMWE